MKKNSMVLSGVLSVLIFSACQKENTSSIDRTNDGTFKAYTEGKITTVQNLSADTIIGTTSQGQPTGSGKFTLFNLANGIIIPNADSATTQWDIGFRGTTIITNAGTSGPGNGGAFVQVGSFNDLLTISPDSTFRTDNAPSYAIPVGSGKGWYNYDGPNNLVTPIPGRVLVIRTATGKYAKLEVLNYYKGGSTLSASAPDDEKLRKQRYYTFRYTYQSNGSKTF